VSGARALGGDEAALLIEAKRGGGDAAAAGTSSGPTVAAFVIDSRGARRVLRSKALVRASRRSRFLCRGSDRRSAGLADEYSGDNAIVRSRRVRAGYEPSVALSSARASASDSLSRPLAVGVSFLSGDLIGAGH
jgi:hypothetical protein